MDFGSFFGGAGVDGGGPMGGQENDQMGLEMSLKNLPPKEVLPKPIATNVPVTPAPLTTQPPPLTPKPPESK